MRETSVKKGQVFGQLTALDIHSRDRNGHVRWHCTCSCGNEKDILGTHLSSGKIVSCGCRIIRGKDRKDWTGYEGLSGRFWSQIKRGANGSKGRRVLPFTITIEDAWSQFVKQGGLCALSGVPISPATVWRGACTASLDRIDSSRGYEPDNIQWLHKDVNKMKNSFHQTYFLDWCRKIVDYTPKDVIR